MTAREIIFPFASDDMIGRNPTISADAHIIDVLHKLVDSPTERLDVVDNSGIIGCVTTESLLTALSSFIAQRDDTSTIVFECFPRDYSASIIARAVEDSDTHIVDLLTSPAKDGKIRVTIRVRLSDPTSVVRNLQRYGYETTHTFAGSNSMMASIAKERLENLRTLLSI